MRAFGIEPKTSSPSSKTASIPEIRGDPSARKVAIVLCRCASNSARTALRERRLFPFDVPPCRHAPTTSSRIRGAGPNLVCSSPQLAKPTFW